MLFKLIKYDLRADYVKFAIMTAALLVIMTALRLTGADAVMGIGTLIICYAVFVASTIITAVRYQKKIYTDEGYLMNTLPVNPSLHIFATIITYYIWTITVFAVISLTGLITGYNLAEITLWVIRDIRSYSLDYAVFEVIILAFYPMLEILIIILIINFAYLFQRHRILAGLGCYIVMTSAAQILTAIVSFLLGRPNMNVSSFAVLFGFYSENSDADSTSQLLADIMDGSCLTLLAANGILFLCYFLLSRYILNKKFNID